MLTKAAQVPHENQLRDMFDAKVRRGIFKPVLRHLPAEIAEDRVQDAICQVFAMYKRYALEKHVILSDAILVHSCRQRAVDPDRFFVLNDKKRRNCPLDIRHYLRGHVEVLHLDGIPEDEEDQPYPDGDVQLIGLYAAMSISPSRAMNSAIDLESWLEELDGDERRLMEARAAGFTLEEAATDLGCSTSTVWARVKQLGVALALRVGVEVEETRRCAVREAA